MSSIPPITYYLGIFYKKEYYLIGSKMGFSLMAWDHYASLKEAQEKFFPFQFLFERLPQGKDETQLLELLDEVNFLVYGVPKAVSRNIKEYVELPALPFPDHFPIIPNQGGIMLKIRKGKGFASYPVYHLNTDILNKNPAIPSKLRGLAIGNDEEYLRNDPRINLN